MRFLFEMRFLLLKSLRQFNIANKSFPVEKSDPFSKFS